MKKLGPVWLWIAATFVMAIIATVVVFYTSVFSTNIANNQETWGQFGDYFGGVLNPLLSFCAFMALLFTLHEQRESSKASDARYQEQEREQRFFQMINLLSQVSSQVTWTSTEGIVEYHEGRSATHGAWLSFASGKLADIRKKEFDNDMDRFVFLNQSFVGWRRTNWPSVGNFLETAFTLFSYVYWIIPKDKDFSSFALGFLKSNLSESERLLLWYTSLCTRDYHRYCTMLRLSGFVDDINGSLDDPLKPYAWQLNFASVAYWESFGEDQK